MRCLVPLLAAVAAMSSLVACTAPTEILVIVETDIADIDELVVEARVGDGMVQRATASLATQPSPRRLVLEHRGGPLGPVRIVASARRSDTEIVRAQRVSAFTPNARVEIRISLESACVGVSCPEGVCTGGVCTCVDCSDAGTRDASLDGDVDGGAPVDAWSSDAYRCADDSDCADGEDCNGTETCMGGACASGMGLPDGSACEGGTGECVAGRCVPNECASALECDDGDVCTGAETCEAMRCVRGPVPTCDDADACTADGCPSPSGCTHTLIDEDGDGHAPTSLGACGTDCDDTRMEVAPDAVEICGNSRDDDCDGTTDEAPTTTWYEDCDGDGFARAGARAIMACARPAPSVSMCLTGGGWTARDPGEESDCNDDNADVNPGQRTFQTSAIGGASASDDYDYNCDRVEERRSTAGGRCERTWFSCTRTEGWVGGVPECGATAEWVTGCSTTLTGCSTATDRRPQACR